MSYVVFSLSFNSNCFKISIVISFCPPGYLYPSLVHWRPSNAADVHVDLWQRWEGCDGDTSHSVSHRHKTPLQSSILTLQCTWAFASSNRLHHICFNGKIRCLFFSPSLLEKGHFMKVSDASTLAPNTPEEPSLSSSTAF